MYVNGHHVRNPILKTLLGLAAAILIIFIILPFTGILVSFSLGFTGLIILGIIIGLPLIIMGSLLFVPLFRFFARVGIILLILTISGAAFGFPVILLALIISGLLMLIF